MRLDFTDTGVWVAIYVLDGVAATAVLLNRTRMPWWECLALGYVVGVLAVVSIPVVWTIMRRTGRA